MSCMPACRGSKGYPANRVKGVAGTPHVGRLGEREVLQQMVVLNHRREKEFKQALIEQLVATGVSNVKVTRE